MLEMSSTISHIAKALVGAQADVGVALKNQENAHFKSQYADLPAVLEVATPALAKHGLALVQCPGEGEGTLTLTTLLLHETGEWMVLPPASMPLQARTAHGYGSAISYLRRYTTQACLKISVGLSDDDDANEASAQAPAPKRAAPRKSRAASKPLQPPQEWSKSWDGVAAPQSDDADDAKLDKALDDLSTAIVECEADGGIEARHIKLARSVVAKRGTGAKKSPIDRVTGATTYLAKLLARHPPTSSEE